MKKILITILSLAVVAVSCQKAEYVPGTPDAEKCINITFPDQDVMDEDIEISSDSAKVIEIEVERALTEGEITVPLKISAADGGEIFSVSDAKFADGEATTTAKVNFPNAVVGKTYPIIISVADENLVLKYKQGVVNSITFTVTVAKWNTLATGTYSSFFFKADFKNVILQQSDMDPDQYRFYGIDMMANGKLLFNKAGDVSENVISVRVPQQAVDYVHPSYGQVYLVDAITNKIATKPESCTLNTKTYAYNVATSYKVSAGTFDSNYDTFTPNPE